MFEGHSRIAPSTTGVAFLSSDCVNADEFLESLVQKLHSTSDPEPDLIAEVGCGDLENLIREDGETLWPRIEQLARTDERFRRALSSVWAYDSPEYERRTTLLRELGETRLVRVSFVVEPEDFTPVPRVGWRAVKIEGEPPGRQLGRLLREVADWYEREQSPDNPEVVKRRAHWSLYFDWATVAHALERLWHEVAVAPDAGALEDAIDRADALKQREEHAWRRFVTAIRESRGGADA